MCARLLFMPGRQQRVNKCPPSSPPFLSPTARALSLVSIVPVMGCHFPHALQSCPAAFLMSPSPAEPSAAQMEKAPYSWSKTRGEQGPPPQRPGEKQPSWDEGPGLRGRVGSGPGARTSTDAPVSSLLKNLQGLPMSCPGLAARQGQRSPCGCWF